MIRDFFLFLNIISVIIWMSCYIDLIENGNVSLLE